MNRESKMISVTLRKVNEKDVLVFVLDESFTVNLNSEESQNELKNIFSQLLRMMLVYDIKLKLNIAEGYKEGLFIDVCTEYISELNREIAIVYPKMKEVVGEVGK